MAKLQAMNETKTTFRRRQVALAGVAVLCVLGGWQASRAAGPRTVWEGIYTAAQAERGQKVLIEQCSICHGEAMRGGGGVPSAVGPEFMFNWDGRTVAELFTYLKTTMPPTAPGSLTDQRYADVMAALFRHNGFPESAAEEIPADPAALADVTIARTKP